METVAKDVQTFKMLTFSDTKGITGFIENRKDLLPNYSSSQKVLDRFSHANLATELDEVLNQINE